MRPSEEEVRQVERERIQVLNSMEELEKKIKELDNQMEESAREVDRLDRRMDNILHCNISFFFSVKSRSTVLKRNKIKSSHYQVVLLEVLIKIRINQYIEIEKNL